MHPVSLLAVIGISLMLAACSSTSEDLRRAPRETATFVVDRPFSEVSKNFISKASQCYRHGTPASDFYAQRHVSKQGELETVEIIQDGIARRVVIAADLTGKPQGTEITYFVHSGFSMFVTFRPVIEGWATGKDNGCGLLFN